MEFSGLAEKTVDEVLGHFGKTIGEARRNYRDFVQKGISLGRRPEFQGGGLYRSLGGKKAAVSEIKKGQRQQADRRILGGGDFVSATLKQAGKSLEKKYLPKRPVDEIIEEVGQKLDLSPQLICSGSRKKEICQARALAAYLAIEKEGHKGSEVARVLQVHRVSLQAALKKGREMFEKLGLETENA